MKNKLLPFIAATLFLANEDGFSNPPITIETEEDRLNRIKDQEIKSNKAKGLKSFDIDGETVWAINEKNAKRKHARK